MNFENFSENLVIDEQEESNPVDSSHSLQQQQQQQQPTQQQQEELCHDQQLRSIEQCQDSLPIRTAMHANQVQEEPLDFSYIVADVTDPKHNFGTTFSLDGVRFVCENDGTTWFCMNDYVKDIGYVHTNKVQRLVKPENVREHKEFKRMIPGLSSAAKFTNVLGLFQIAYGARKTRAPEQLIGMCMVIFNKAVALTKQMLTNRNDEIEKLTTENKKLMTTNQQLEEMLLEYERINDEQITRNVGENATSNCVGESRSLNTNAFNVFSNTNNTCNFGDTNSSFRIDTNASYLNSGNASSINKLSSSIFKDMHTPLLKHSNDPYLNNSNMVNISNEKITDQSFLDQNDCVTQANHEDTLIEHEFNNIEGNEILSLSQETLNNVTQNVSLNLHRQSVICDSRNLASQQCRNQSQSFITVNQNDSTANVSPLQNESQEVNLANITERTQLDIRRPRKSIPSKLPPSKVSRTALIPYNRPLQVMVIVRKSSDPPGSYNISRGNARYIAGKIREIKRSDPEAQCIGEFECKDAHGCFQAFVESLLQNDLVSRIRGKNSNTLQLKRISLQHFTSYAKHVASQH